MAAPVRISAVTARRFVLGRHGLWPARRWEGLDGTRQAMLAGEYLQLDPLGILARSHDLVLHSRVTGYEPAHFNQLTYERREFFEWGGWLAVRPMEELPYWRTIMRREREHQGMRQLAEAYGPVIEEMRLTLRERDTVANADFAHDGPALDHYRGGKPTSLALYYLWRTGEAMTHHRERFLRVYAAAESIAPVHLLTEAPDEDADLMLARKSIAFAAIGRAGRVGMPLSRLLARTITRTEQLALERNLVDRGEVVPVEVEGTKGVQFVLKEDFPLLEAVDLGAVPEAWGPPSSSPSVALLSPLDPVSARGRAKALWGFDYMWEIYLPAEKVQFGRYTLPILFGDDLVGRVDMKLDRKTSTLVVNGLWFEPHAAAVPKDEAFRSAFATEIQRLRTLVGAKKVDAAAVKTAWRGLFRRR